MNKNIIITGADFHINGYQYREVTKTETTLYTYDGEVVTNPSEQLSEANKNDGIYWYEHNQTHKCTKGGVLSNVCSTSPSNLSSDKIITVPEGYTKVEITTCCDIIPQTVLCGGLILGFLNSNKELIGGITNGDTNGNTNVNKEECITEIVPHSTELRTFTRNIPSDCKYLIATLNPASYFENFKIVLSGTVIE